MFNINSNLYRFIHYQYGVIKYSNISEYYIVLDKENIVKFDSRVGDLDK